jgi:hypothetical protein
MQEATCTLTSAAPPPLFNHQAINPDPELLALCREFDERRERIVSLSLAKEADVPRGEIEALVDRCWEIRTAVTDLPARTREGLLAKAKLALWECGDGDPEDGLCEGSNTQVAWSLARDVLARAGV